MPGLGALKARYDLVVIGGGVHGAAAVLEAAHRRCSVLLVERGDFCSATSANSLKIIHGGLRYLRSGDLRRSRESAREQRALIRLAPHLVRPLPCLVGTEPGLGAGRPVTALGLWLYDHIVCAGLGPWPRGRLLSVGEASGLAGFDVFDGCSGAALWHDAQVLDSERLVLSYLMTAEAAGADIRNYTEATGVERGSELRVALRDADGETTAVETGAVIDTASLLDPHPAWTRAVNLVVDRPPGQCAFGLKSSRASPDAGRFFFATPLDGRLIVGTWYFPPRLDGLDKLDPGELRRCVEDIRELIPVAGVSESDISLIHVGRLPVSDAARPLSLLEKPVIRHVDGDSRLISVTGVKYTTARPVAARAVAKALGRATMEGTAAAIGGRPSAFYGAAASMESVEKDIAAALSGRLESHQVAPVARALRRRYGAVGITIARRAARSARGSESIPRQQAIRAEIEYCVETEHCRTVGDFLLRRSGIGSLGPPADETVRYCAATMAACLGWPDERVDAEIADLHSHYQRVQESSC